MAISSVVSNSLQKPLAGMADTLVNERVPILIPEPGDIIDALFRGTCTSLNARAVLRGHGVFTGLLGKNDPCKLSKNKQDALERIWEKALGAKGQWLTPEQLLSLWNRRVIDEDQFNLHLQRWGFNPLVKPDWIKALKNEIPGPSDLVTFVVRDIWRADLVKKYGYDLDYPFEFGDWLGKQGLNYEIPSPAHVAEGLGNLTWAKAYWWSHWQVPSVGQGIQMLQRLRPKLGTDKDPRDPSGIIFKRQDLLELIQVSDYPKYWQDKLLSIGYVPIGIRNLRALWAAGLADQTEITEIFLDQGYVERDARLQARLIAGEKAAQQLLSGKVTTIRLTMQSYEIGMIDRGQCLRTIHSLLLRTRPEVVAFNQLEEGNQNAAAANNPVAQQMVGNADLVLNQSRFKRTLSILGRAYLRGQISDPDLRKQLIALGLVPGRIDQMMRDWQLERQLPRRLPSISQALKWLADGLISADQVRTMLAQLGWVSQDVDAILAEAALEQIGKRVRAVKASANAARKTQTLAAQQAKAAMSIQRQAQASLRRSANPGRLAKWFGEGLITPAQFTSRLVQIGIAPADAALWAKEITEEVAAKQAKAVEAAAAKTEPLPVRPKRVPAATIGGWYKKGFITKEAFAIRLTALGYNPDDIKRLEQQYAPSGT